jgi:hypothetical protein
MGRQSGKINRREFLRIAGSAAISTTLAVSGVVSVAERIACGNDASDLDQYDFVMPRVKFVEQGREGQGRGPDVWNVRPGGDANLLDEFSKVIRCKTKPIRGANNWEPQYAEPGQLNAVVTFDKLEDLTKYPFLFMTGENFYTFTQNQKYNLREYIVRGGFLLMDDCVVGNGGDFFYQSSYQLLEEVFGRGAVTRIPPEHEIFHNVYDLGDTGLPLLDYPKRQAPGHLPYMHGQNHGARGVFIEDRLAIFLGSTDIHCGWCDRQGFEFGRPNYEKAIQMGINIIMYAISH